MRGEIRPAELRPRLLCLGDLHLGRTPSRLPGWLADRNLARTELGPAAALDNAVRFALEEARCGRPIDACLFAGDLVERELDFVEGYGHLRTAAQRLSAARVSVLVVAGNHDAHVAPRLAQAGVGFELLGAGGRWQSRLVEREGRPVARIVGWSFPRREVRESPLGAFPEAWARGEFGDGADVPTAGLLHADLDRAASRYAPVSRAELASKSTVGAWLVGHVHAPDREGLAAARPLGYLGSLTGLDPGEPGPHGPWLAEWDGARWRMSQMPLAPLRFEALRVDATGATGIEELEARLVHGLDALHAVVSAESGALRIVGLRLRLAGRSGVSPHGRATWMRALREQPLTRGDLAYFVEQAADETSPEIDLSRLAAGDDPIGLLASRLLALEEGGERCRALVNGAAPLLAEASRAADFALLSDPPCSAEDARALLIAAARRALEELLEQRGAAAPASAPAPRFSLELSPEESAR